MDLPVILVLNGIEIKTQAKLILDSEYSAIPSNLLTLNEPVKIKCDTDSPQPAANNLKGRYEWFSQQSGLEDLAGCMPLEPYGDSLKRRVSSTRGAALCHAPEHFGDLPLRAGRAGLPQAGESVGSREAGTDGFTRGWKMPGECPILRSRVLHALVKYWALPGVLQLCDGTRSCAHHPPR